jgi:hypothetical protein
VYQQRLINHSTSWLQFSQGQLLIVVPFFLSIIWDGIMHASSFVPDLDLSPTSYTHVVMHCPKISAGCCLSSGPSSLTTKDTQPQSGCCQGRRLTQLHVHILTVQPLTATPQTTPSSSFVTLTRPPYSTLCTSLSALRLFVILANCSCHYSLPLPNNTTLDSTLDDLRKGTLHGLALPLVR